MCQVDEEYQEVLEDTEGTSVCKKCVKCKDASAAVVIRAGDTYCRDCFKEYFIHKFRAMLGKNRIIFPGEKVLLAVSGGPSSCAMLSQVQEGLSQSAHKKLRFSPGIVYVDEGGVVGQSMEERQRTVAELQDVFTASGFPFHIVPLEQVLDLPVAVATDPSPSEPDDSEAYKAAVGHFLQMEISGGGATSRDHEPTSQAEVQATETQQLQQLMGSVKTLTARQDLLNTLRQHLLVHTARRHGYGKVMLGENCTRSAVKLLTSISLGRGAQLAQDTGFSDTRYGDVTLVRPMRDHSAKEIAYYNRMFSVATVFAPGLDTKASDKSSIQRLTESFVTRLQADFPSTVSTIYRTSEKLQTACKSAAAEASDACLLCACGLDTAGEKSSAFQATLTSEQLSRRKADAPACNAAPQESGAQCCSSGGGAGEGDCGRSGSGGSCCSSANEPEETDLTSLLCYSCRLTIKDMTSVQHLPRFLLSEAQRRTRRSQMREEISHFLLEDGD